jgi:hypothetical protein
MGKNGVLGAAGAGNVSVDRRSANYTLVWWSLHLGTVATDSSIVLVNRIFIKTLRRWNLMINCRAFALWTHRARL